MLGECCRASLGACALEAVVLVAVFCVYFSFFFFFSPPLTRGKAVCSRFHSSWGDEPWKASTKGVKARAPFMPGCSMRGLPIYLIREAL